MFDFKKEQFVVMKLLKKAFSKTKTCTLGKGEIISLGIDNTHFSSILSALNKEGGLVVVDSFMRATDDLCVVNYSHSLEQADLIEVSKGKNFEKIYKSLQRAVGGKEKKEKLIKNRAFKLPKNFDWVELKLAFKDEVTFQAYYKDEYLGEISNEDLGCYKKNSRSRKYDNQWLFLLKLSAYSISMYSSKTNDAEKNRQTKKKVSDRLKVFFETDESPFREVSWTNEYELKFEIVPPPGIRNDGEIFKIKDE